MNEQQKKYLRGLAHPRKPVVMLGTGGFSDAVRAELEVALDAHELVKVKVRVGDREARDAVVAEIVAATRAVQVQRVGHVLTLYRARAKDPRIQLP